MTPRETLLAEAAKRILVIDGAFGTEIQSRKLSEADYAGSLGLTREQKGNNDILALTMPEVPEAIHRAYFEAGADIVETNTFSCTSIAQADYGMEAFVYELNLRAAEIAAACAARWTERTPGQPRFVAGALGPTPKTLSISPDVDDASARNLTFDELAVSKA